MTRWLQAAQNAQVAGTQPTKPTKPGPGDVSSVLSVVSGANEPEPPFPQGASTPGEQVWIEGYQRTWTGRLVRRADWDGLSEWDRHGPNGRHWCGVARAWIEAKGEHNGK